MKFAQFGTVSSGTMRLEDLLPDLAWELEHHERENNSSRYAGLIKEAKEIDADDENASEVLEELFDALNNYAPPYAYFGAHPGDGADYGFWLMEGFDEALADNGGIKVDDSSEIPADFEGEALIVNDHGNCTLIYCDGRGKETELWSVV